MEGMRMLGEALLGFMRWDILLSVVWSTGLGIIIGMLPGLTATMGVALLTTLTFKMAANNAIITLVCMYIGAIYGGSRSAILLNIPGTPANAATCVDGYPLAKQGLAGRAIGIATTGSFLGSVIGMIVMAFFTPWLGRQALLFKSFEMFWFAIFGIIICGNLTAPKDPIKGWIAGFIGLLVSMVGMEGRWSYPRFSFGSVEISGGIQLIPAMVGAFGFAEIIAVMRHPVMETVSTKIDRIWPQAQGHHDVLEDHHTVGHRGHHHRHHPRRRRGHRRVGFLRPGQAVLQGKREVRPRLDRGPHGSGDRQQRLRAREPSSPC